MPTTPTKVLTALVTATVVVSVGAAANASLDSSDDAQPLTPAEAGEIKTAAVPSVQTAIENTFAIFRNQAPDAMPPSVQAQVGSPERHGRNASLARSFDTPYGTGWIIPGDGAVCIAVPTTTNGYGTSCIPTELAVERGLWLRVGSASGKNLDTLIVPDGASAASGGKRLSAASNGVVTEVSSGNDAPPRVTRNR